MAGVSFDILFGVVLYLMSVWGAGRLFKMATLPAILGELLAGIVLGPELLDVVPFASDGTCIRLIDDAASSSGSSSGSERMLAEVEACKASLVWSPRWGDDPIFTNDIWSFAGTVGVTLLIMESGMHINFEKVKLIGGKAFVVAIIGTAMPMVMGMLLIAALFPGKLYPEGFAAGCALAPTSVGISIKLLSDAKMLNSMAGQTTLTAAFIDDVFSLVLLVLLASLSEGQADAGVIALKTIAAFTFLGYGVVGGKHLYPKLDYWLSQITFVKGASIQPRDEIHLVIMIGSLVLYSYLGSLIGSHLLGAFVAGMCFVNVPRSHQVWVAQFKRIIRWLIRIFFSATVGFAVPLSEMFTTEAFLRGLVIGVGPGLLCKIVSGVAARTAFQSETHKKMASQASIMTRGGIVQPIQYLVGMAMVARGEFAFLVAYSASKMTMPDQSSMLSPPVYACVTWALVWALIFAPFLFKWALGVYMRASPIQRGTAIGGSASASRNFVIQVVGQHHSGVLHEILNSIHGEGMDVLECRVETDGDVDCNYFVVQSRGKQKDFDDEKLEEIRHHITEILGDPNAVVMFESVADEQVDFGAIEVQIVSDNSKSVHGGVLAKQGNIMSLVAKRIAEFGLDVEEMDEQHKVQVDHGLETEMERDLFYAVRSQTSDEAAAITHKTVQQLKRALQSMLRDEEIKAEVVVKPVADRTKGFSELQTFDPQQAVARARGQVWELLCFGPHNVELLSTAVRRLTPLGLRLLHAAHSHAHVEGEARGDVCSRIYVEHVEDSERTEEESEEEVSAFRAAVLKVLMGTYNSEDATKFSVRKVDEASLEKLQEEYNASLEAVPGVHHASPVVARRDLKAPAASSVPDNLVLLVPDNLVDGYLKQIPQRPAGEMSEVLAQQRWLAGNSPPLGPSAAPGPRSRRASREWLSPEETPGESARVEELEAKVAQLESLVERVGRLEGRVSSEEAASGSMSSLGLPVTSSPV